ncbi:MAG: sulfatase-like hydrolase/transferase [Alphaproteobacteria bacterium]
MKPMNILYIMSDQHQGKASGCYGHPFVRTPNIDRLAARGTRFTAAYTNSAICVPARAVIATGQYVFKTGHWCNAHPYDGRTKSWHHMLAENGVAATSIGKLHFRNQRDDTGFAEQIVPMHVVEGKGDLRSCIKRPMAGPMKASKTMTDIGPGDSPYIKYDRDIAERACAWLRARAEKPGASPFVAFVSFVCPHPPYIAPREFYEMYPVAGMPAPKLSDPGAVTHPWIQKMERNRNYNDFVTEESRRVVLASYYGCISYLDHNIGTVLDCLDECGLRDDTLIVYTSDHGDNLGTRRLFGKSNMYEESANIPMIVAGPGVPERKVSATPVTLLDVAPTMLDGAGLKQLAGQHGMPGRSLRDLAAADANPDRVAFCEYYAAAADRAAFMIRKGKYKYIHYVGYAPELFDLQSDPEEIADLAGKASHRKTVEEYEAILRGIVDPEAADDEAYRCQTALVNANGGREALISRGKFEGTPAPGEPAIFTR